MVPMIKWRFRAGIVSPYMRVRKAYTFVANSKHI